tara:strand:- start:199 stop:399 length:201 start_codon:yes stop_codon:yes gene_type:complete
MIRVYVEHEGESTLIAKFINEAIYEKCFPVLDEIKEENNWEKLTEAYEESSLDDEPCIVYTYEKGE